MVRSLHVVEICQAGGKETEASDDDIVVAADASESVRGRHADDEVEDPIAAGRERHALAAASEGEDLGGEEPGHRSPGETVGGVVDDNEGVDAVCLGFDV